MDPGIGYILAIILVALAFDFINGFHDSANSIATVVATRVLSPGTAVLWAAFFNFVAAFLVGTAVARTIGKGLVQPSVLDPDVILAALFGAIAWNLITWYFGLPSSSSHALMGGLGGAAVAKAGATALIAGGWVKPILFIFLAPLIGMALALGLTVALSWALKNQAPGPMDRVFRRLRTRDPEKAMDITRAGAAARRRGRNPAGRSGPAAIERRRSRRTLADFRMGDQQQSR